MRDPACDTSSVAQERTADPDLSGRRLGEFVLHEQIGEGGYGTVYRCEQPTLRRDAVIKVLHGRRNRSDVARERFLREAQLASRLDHPYAAHVYSFGAEDDGLLWIAMELVQGVTLGEWIRTRGPMPLEEFVPYFERVAQVVQAAHERGIVHRDLKPSNMMVIESGGRLFPKLLDFGIAKLNDGPDVPEEENDAAVRDAVATRRIRVAPLRFRRTRTADPSLAVCLTLPGVAMGSVPYMSPEQWGASYSVGPATDIYSLGCIAYEALTGRPPFTAESTREYYERHRRAEPPPLDPSFSRSLDHVLRRALAKSPQARHASAVDLAAELRAALRTEPVEAVAFSRDGKLVAAGSRDGVMQVWHVDSGTLRTQLNPRHSKILAIEFDPTSQLLLAANSDGTVVVADTRQGLSTAQLEGPRNVVLVARFDGHSRVVGASWDGTARVWDTTPPYRRWSSEPMSDGCGIAGAASDERFIAVGCGARPTRVWDTLRDRLHAELPNATLIESGGFTSASPAVSSEGDRAAGPHRG